LNRDTDNASSLGKSTYTVAPPPQQREITGTIEFNTSNDVVGAELVQTTHQLTMNYEDSFFTTASGAAPAIMTRLEDASGKLS
jgi:hypothetical protein